MAFVTADRVRDTSTTAGSGSFSVSGTAPTGYRTFSAVLSVSDTFYYSIQHQTLNEWEVGLGTYSSANTFARTTIYSSSNAGSAVTFSAGTKDVFITMAAARSLQLDASGNVTPAINGTLAWQSVQTGNFTAVAGNAYPINTTSGAVTVTLPASPTAGQAIQIVDYAGTWQTNNVTIAPNGAKINSSTNNYIAALRRESLAFVYIDSTQGWIVYSAANESNSYGALYLIVAGGGAGGADDGGGGGAGGLLASGITLTSGAVYTVVVGAGGAGVAQGVTSNSGSNSSIIGVTAAIGGGYGARRDNNVNNGASGGSGGGASINTLGTASGAGGSGTSGQGNSGGLAGAGSPSYGGGGGGGASAAGSNGTTTAGGKGGNGSASSITGSSVTYAGGGGGSTRSGSAGAGGTGGGGAGAITGNNGTAGTANTGGGGGGAAFNSGSSGSGGSGVVILSVPTLFYSGTTTGSPTVTTSGSNTILVFNASGSYTA
jgi:hypothetical protein